MERTTKRVIAAAETSRVTSLALAILAAIMVITSFIEAQDRIRAIVTVLLTGVIYSLVMMAILGRTVTAPPPEIISARELPPSKRSWVAVVQSTMFFGAFDAAVALYALSQHPQEYFLIGIALGVPTMSLQMYFRALRIERELGGSYWVPSSWGSSRRPRYVVRAPLP